MAEEITYFPSAFYIEYGLAQIGALQLWRNARSNKDETVKKYIHALSMGGTLELRDLYLAAGLEFRFDSGLLTELVSLLETTILELEKLFKK